MENLFHGGFFMPDNYRRYAALSKVVDGDTLDLEIDVAFRFYTALRVRLAHVNTPETYGVKKDSEEYQKGQAAKAFVEQWLEDHCPKDDFGRPQVTIHSLKETGKYGRWIVEVYDPEETRQLNQDLLDAGHADPYDV